MTWVFVFCICRCSQVFLFLALDVFGWKLNSYIFSFPIVWAIDEASKRAFSWMIWYCEKTKNEWLKIFWWSQLDDLLWNFWFLFLAVWGEGVNHRIFRGLFVVLFLGVLTHCASKTQVRVRYRVVPQRSPEGFQLPKQSPPARGLLLWITNRVLGVNLDLFLLGKFCFCRTWSCVSRIHHQVCGLSALHP